MIHVCGFGIWGWLVCEHCPLLFLLTLAMVPLFLDVGVCALLALLATPLGRAPHFHVRRFGLVTPHTSTTNLAPLPGRIDLQPLGFFKLAVPTLGGCTSCLD
ncbi:hypothetical protein KP509_19G043300 [Ceratopteris richardii]|uniref:Uncharacterized protein n=1 Tax=Ceratopteris richardii TaxID=49495 RepID=A0A8T2SJS4_CERRI|nr:hypothetical protein KP509_19G043300 [Ceratopteris richardii]